MHQGFKQQTALYKHADFVLGPHGHTQKKGNEVGQAPREHDQRESVHCFRTWVFDMLFIAAYMKGRVSHAKKVKKMACCGGKLQLHISYYL